MSNMHNLGTVIKFEIVRMLKKPTFWIMAMGFPVLVAAIFGIVFWSNRTTAEAVDKLKEEKFSLVVTDDSKLIEPELLHAFNATTVESRQLGIDKVKQGHIDAYLYFPSDVSKGGVEVYGKDVGLFNNGRYSALATALLNQSVNTQVNATQQAVLQGKVAISATTFRDGREYDGIKEMIAPGLFLVLFYVLIGFFGGQMLNSTIEEKENRTIEMLLTTIKPTALITGKIISLIILAFIQAAVILVPILLLYFLAAPQLNIPNLDLTNIPLDPLKIGLNAAIFTLSFLLFTGLLVAIGAAMPTAKEASQWFGFVMIFIFGPLYGVTSFISHPDSPFVHFLTLFPLTSPIPLMLRNAYGNLTIQEALLGILFLAIATVIVSFIAVRIFRYGAMEYDARISFKALRAKRTK